MLPSACLPPFPLLHMETDTHVHAYIDLYLMRGKCIMYIDLYILIAIHFSMYRSMYACTSIFNARYIHPRMLPSACLPPFPLLHMCVCVCVCVCVYVCERVCAAICMPTSSSFVAHENRYLCTCLYRCIHTEILGQANKQTNQHTPVVAHEHNILTYKQNDIHTHIQIHTHIYILTCKQECMH